MKFPKLTFLLKVERSDQTFGPMIPFKIIIRRSGRKWAEFELPLEDNKEGPVNGRPNNNNKALGYG